MDLYKPARCGSSTVAPNLRGLPLMHRRRIVAVVVAGVSAFMACSSVRAGLDEYVKKAEPAFAWKLREKAETEQGMVYDLHLVSQTWQNIKWEHQLQIYLPKG